MNRDPFSALPGDLGSDLVALVEEVLSTQEGGERERAGATLEALDAELRMRFTQEELLMASCGYRDRERHVAGHTAFLAELAEARRALACTGLTVRLCSWLGRRCGGWMRDHARGEDAALARYLAERAASRRGIAPPRTLASAS